jgi:hypothetical protein
VTVRIVSNLDQWDDAWILDGCGYCGDPDKPATVVVFGQPMADLITVVDSSGCRCCGECAKPAIWLALTEADWSRPAVRVVPIKAVA